MVEIATQTSPRVIRMAARHDDVAHLDPVIPVADEELQEYRCNRCDRLLFKARLTSGSTVSIMCHNKWCRDRKRIAKFSVA